MGALPESRRMDGTEENTSVKFPHGYFRLELEMVGIWNLYRSLGAQAKKLIEFRD